MPAPHLTDSGFTQNLVSFLYTRQYDSIMSRRGVSEPNHPCTLSCPRIIHPCFSFIIIGNMG